MAAGRDGTKLFEKHHKLVPEATQFQQGFCRLGVNVFLFHRHRSQERIRYDVAIIAKSDKIDPSDCVKPGLDCVASPVMVCPRPLPLSAPHTRWCAVSNVYQQASPTVG